MSDSRSLLIKGAEVSHRKLLDLRCQAGIIRECSSELSPNPGEEVIDAKGCALIPGLHDHHIHVLSLAARLSSVECGPPSVSDSNQLAEIIRTYPGHGWVRGVGYHESVAGVLNRKALDAIERDRPVRIQHRSGRVWWLNTRALTELRLNTKGDGELYRMDERVRQNSQLSESFKTDIVEVFSRLLGMGVTGVTDATPSNDDTMESLLREISADRVNVQVMGNEQLTKGPLKLLIDDYRLPDVDSFERRISDAHRADRTVAIHCVSRVELVFALAALQRVGVVKGDRIEHASVVDADTLESIRELGLTVVTQPNFIFERGDQYTHDLHYDELQALYRIGGLLEERISVGAGTDAPFGSPDPWLAIRSAVERKTNSGRVLNADECISADRALKLYTTPPEDPGGTPRRLDVGQCADLVLLSQPWEETQKSLFSESVQLTIVKGKVQYKKHAA